MKKIIYTCTILFLISCKKEIVVKDMVNDVKDTIHNEEIKFVSFGDKIISESDFISQMQDTTNPKHLRKKLSKIKFDYHQFNEWDFNTIEKKNIGDITLELKKEKNNNTNADISEQISLSVYKNNKKTDDILIYKYENYAEALVAISQFFYFDFDLNLWLLEFNEDEEGIHFVFWNQYKIDKNTGKINLIKSTKTNDTDSLNSDENSI